jgi:phage/plasmid-like protein (TIGR03299 family)
MTLIGFTDKRGKAWHWRESDQGVEPNHYAGAIPLEDVRRRLFFWQPVEGEHLSRYVDPETGETETMVSDDVKDIIRPRTDRLGPAKRLSTFKRDFKIHDYSEWLITNVQNILDDSLAIGSAGLLKDGAQAWVQAQMPDNVTTPEGVEFRPYISAATSLDGSLATTYKTGNELIVCDNTMHAALQGDAFRVKIRHTKNSLAKIHDVRSALGVIHQEADDFAKEIKELTSTEVSEKQWQAFLDAYTPLPEVKKTKGGGPGQGYTMAETKRDRLSALYHNDPRVSDWTGTAFGVLQAANTYDNHESIVRGQHSRLERNITMAIKDKRDQKDAEVLDTLRMVLA